MRNMYRRFLSWYTSPFEVINEVLFGQLFIRFTLLYAAADIFCGLLKAVLPDV